MKTNQKRVLSLKNEKEPLDEPQWISLSKTFELLMYQFNEIYLILNPTAGSPPPSDHFTPEEKAFCELAAREAYGRAQAACYLQYGPLRSTFFIPPNGMSPYVHCFMAFIDDLPNDKASQVLKPMELLALSLWQDALIRKGTEKIRAKHNQKIKGLLGDDARFFRHCFQNLEIFLSHLFKDEWLPHGLSKHPFSCPNSLVCFPTIYRIPILEYEN